MNITTPADLRKLVGDSHLAGLDAEHIVVLIHEARSVLKETGNMAHAADAVRRLAASLRRAEGANGAG